MKSYKQIKIERDKVHRFHRVLMENHLGRKLNKNENVHHKDGNIFNNSLDNLEVLPVSQHSRLHTRERMSNLLEREKISKACIGKKHSPQTIEKMSNFTLTSRHTAKLIEEDVRDIRKMIQDKIPYWLIGFIYNVSPMNIAHIKSGKTWSWLK